MKIKELKEALNKLGPDHDDKEVRVWRPGTYIRLGRVFPNKGNILIEGNVEPAIALGEL